MMRRTTLVLVLGLGLASSSEAQTVVPLAEALQQARAESLPVLSASAQVASANATLAAVEDSRWPSLSLSMGGGQRYGLAFDQTTGGLTQATVESVDAGLFARYIVFDGFERRAQRRSAEASLRAAELTRVRAGQDAAQAVLAGYLAVAEAEALQSIAEANEEAERQLLTEVEAQVEYGARPAFEIEQQRERVAAAQGAGLQAARQRDRAAAQLIQILGLSPMESYAFPLPETGADEAVSPVDELVTRALASRPDVQAAEAAQLAVRADRRAARSGRLPQVTLTGGMGTSYTSANTDTGIPGQLGDNRSGSLGLSVSLPLMDRGATRSRIRQAEARATRVDVEAETVRRTIVFEIQDTVTDLESLAAQAEVAAVRQRAAAAALDAELARFAAGATTLQTVAQLRSRAVEAQVELERLRIQRQVQAQILELVIGHPE
ncbi:MAG: TolC family protein [Bacteroidota bacterium]